VEAATDEGEEVIYCALYAIHVNEVSGLMGKARKAGLHWKFQFIHDNKDHGLLVGPDRETLVKFLGFTHEQAEKEAR
jgi:hypothetical protein